MPPKAKSDKPKKANKAEKSEGAVTKKKKASPNKPVFATYLHRLKAETHRDLTIASDAMFVLDAVVCDFERRLIDKSFEIASDAKSSTLKSKHATAAASVILDGELREGAKTETDKALKAYAKFIEEAAKEKAAKAEAAEAAEA